MFLGIEDFDAEDDIREDFPCPFCSEYFDIVGLSCHIDDEHPLEVCPVCGMQEEVVDMVVHIALQHGNNFKMQQKRKLCKGESHSSTLSLLRRELQEGTLQSLVGGSFIPPPSHTALNPLLSSFIFPVADDVSSVKPHLQNETDTAQKTLEHVTECNDQSYPLSTEDRQEREKRCQLVSNLVWSTIFDDSS